MLEVFDAGFAANPWPVLDRLRRQGGVHRVRTPDGPPAWLMTRYADVRAGLSDTRLTTDTGSAGERDYRGAAVVTPQALAPERAHWRELLGAELAPQRLTELARGVPDLIDTLSKNLDCEDSADLVERLAVPLPAAILGELLGLRGPEREALLDWAGATLLPTADRASAGDTPAARTAIVEAAIERPESADTMIARLAAAHRESGALADLLRYLMFAWYEVLTDLLAGSILTLLTRPDQIRVLRRGRNKSPMVDELLRYISPQVLAGPRFATEDLRVGRYDVRAGDTVLLCLAAANRDPDHVDGPGKLDLTRTRNRQLGLGHGAHACVGAALVRAVTASALEHVFTRWPATTLTVSDRDIGWRCGFRHRGPLTLPVHLA